MYKAVYTKQLEKDVRKLKKSWVNFDVYKSIVKKLLKWEKLDKKYKDHKLKWNYKLRRECHISPDWLLIYKKTKKEIFFERTWSHSELF